MKKIICVLLSLITAFSAFTAVACAADENGNSAVSTEYSQPADMPGDSIAEEPVKPEEPADENGENEKMHKALSLLTLPVSIPAVIIENAVCAVMEILGAPVALGLLGGFFSLAWIAEICDEISGLIHGEAQA